MFFLSSAAILYSRRRFLLKASDYTLRHDYQVEGQKNFTSKVQEECLNVDSFLKLVRQYTDIQELNAEIIRTFVDKIYVEKSEKVSGTRVKKQTICIQWNYIGAVDIPPHK